MSRSTDVSPGSPDDGEGRLDDAVPDGAGPDGHAPDVTEPDVTATDDAEPDADETDGIEPDDAAPTVVAGRDDSGDADDSDETADDAPVAAAAARRTGGRVTRPARGAVASRTDRSPARRPAAPTGRPTPAGERRGPIAAIVLFVRQVISELRKVVTPTSRELGTYVAVVIVFVIVVMAYVGVLDFAIGQLVLWAFGG